MPAVTVVITTYQLEKYIGQCLQELWNQTFQDFEVLIVDDASKDKTRETIQKWKDTYPSRIHTIFLDKNLGMPARTRNVALDSGLIQSKYFIFLDGDDSIEPQFLEKLYNAAIQNDAQVAICAYDRVEDGSNHCLCKEMCGFPPVIAVPPSDDILAFINTSPWNKLWERTCFGDIRFPEFSVGEEVALNFTCYTKASKIAFVDEVLIHYRVRPNSIISNTPEESIWKFARELKQCYDVQTGVFRDTMALIVFLHIGMSMALRAADNPKIEIKEHLRRTEEFFRTNFDWFRKNRFLQFSSLRKHGFKGIALWGCLCAYRMHRFDTVLLLFRFATQKLHVDVKF